MSWGSPGPETWGRWPGLPCARRQERARIRSRWTVWVSYTWKMYVQLNVQLEAYATVRGSGGGSEVIQTPQQDFVLNSYSHPGLRCRWGDLTLLLWPPEETMSPALPCTVIWRWEMPWPLSRCWEFYAGNASILYAEIIYSFILFKSLFTFIGKYVTFFHVYSPASPKSQVLLIILFQVYVAYMCTAVRTSRIYTLLTEI